ncbi:hypothetical protein K5549_012814 [Capra hircus]|nr:hypothetical protein K5549_012814 [Capra hircus]
MEEVVPEASLSPNGVPWLYALFSMLFIFFLFVMFSPFLLEIDQHVKKFLLKCRFTLHNIVHKDKENDDMKIDDLGRPAGPVKILITCSSTYPPIQTLGKNNTG